MFGKFFVPLILIIAIFQHKIVFGQASFIQHPINNEILPFYISAFDLNKDGIIDILSGHLSLVYFQNDGSGGFLRHTIDRNVYALWSIYPVDIDDDSDYDILTAQSGSQEIVLYRNSSFSFSRIVIENNFPGAESVASGDLDGDGRKDIVAINWSNLDGRAGYLSVWYNRGGTNFLRQDIETRVLGGHKVKVVDLNGDGLLDILACAASNWGLFWYENVNNETFLRHTITHNSGLSIFPEDLDRDGDIDIIYTRHSGGEIFIYFNNSNGGFYSSSVFSGLDWPTYTTPGDFNKDGQADFAVVCRGSGDLSWLENMGNFHFQRHVIFNQLPKPFNVAVADLNGDGIDDIITGTYELKKIWWWETVLNKKDITVRSPNGSEQLNAGKMWTIRWKSSGVISAVRIEFSLDGGTTWQTEISRTPNTGSFDWLVPILSSQQCLIKISDANDSAISDQSDGVFTIYEPKTISLVYPNGGEKLIGGKWYDIHWFYSGLITDVNIYFSQDNGQYWDFIGTFANSGMYSWRAPRIISSECLIKIEEAGGAIADLSDANFSISQFKPDTVTNGYEKFMANFYWKSFGENFSGDWKLSSSGIIKNRFIFTGNTDWNLAVILKTEGIIDSLPKITINLDHYPLAAARIQQYSTYVQYTFYSSISSGFHWISIEYNPVQMNQTIYLQKIRFIEDGFSKENWVNQFTTSIMGEVPAPEIYDIFNPQMSVYMIGTMEAYKILKRPDILQYLQRWIDAFFDPSGNPTLNLSKEWTAGIYLMRQLFDETGEVKYKNYFLSISPDSVRNWPRISNGAFISPKYSGDQIQTDGLYRIVYYLLALYDVQKDPYYLQEIVSQIEKYAEILQDPLSGLFYHAYDMDGSAYWADPTSHTSNHFWALGNAFLLTALSEVLWTTASQLNSQDLDSIRYIYSQLAYGCLNAQDSSGLWQTVLNEKQRPGNYLEVSASCLITAGLQMGNRLGLLPTFDFDECIKKGLAAIVRKLYSDPTNDLHISDISGPLQPGHYDDYAALPLSDGHEYLQGAGAFLSAMVRAIDKFYAAIVPPIYGQVTYFIGNKGVSNTKIDIVETSQSPDTVSLENGFFSFPPNYGSNTLLFSKDQGEDVNHALTFYDAALTARSAVGLEHLTQLQKTIGDVSNDGILSAYDAAIIARYSIGLPILSGTHPGHWFFIPDTFITTIAGSDTHLVQITSYISGDVDGSWGIQTLTKKSIVASLSSENMFSTRFSDDTLLLTIHFPDSLDILAFSVDLSMNASRAVVGKTKEENPQHHWQILSETEPNMIRIGGFRIYPEKSGENLTFYLSFKGDVPTRLTIQRFSINGKNFNVNYTTVLSIGTKENFLPTSAKLLPNYPNPFNSQTIIRFMTPESGHSFIEVFDIMGRRIAILQDQKIEAGLHKIIWKVRESQEKIIPSGIYWLRWNFKGKYLKTIKMIYLP